MHFSTGKREERKASSGDWKKKTEGSGEKKNVGQQKIGASCALTSRGTIRVTSIPSCPIDRPVRILSVSSTYILSAPLLVAFFFSPLATLSFSRVPWSPLYARSLAYSITRISCYAAGACNVSTNCTPRAGTTSSGLHWTRVFWFRVAGDGAGRFLAGRREVGRGKSRGRQLAMGVGDRDQLVLLKFCKQIFETPWKVEDAV